jgi:hypothetical protein
MRARVRGTRRRVATAAARSSPTLPFSSREPSPMRPSSHP